MVARGAVSAEPNSFKIDILVESLHFLQRVLGLGRSLAATVCYNTILAGLAWILTNMVVSLSLMPQVLANDRNFRYFHLDQQKPR